MTIVYPKCLPLAENVSGVEKAEFEAFWNSFNTDVDKLLDKASSVVVDLRGNTGGASGGFIQNIINARLANLHIHGCVLVDNGVFSAGIWTAAALKQIGYPLVGELMGQPIARYGNNSQNSLKLGGERIGYGISTEYYDLDTIFPIKNKHQSRFPDILVSHNIKALLNGEDVMLAKAKEVSRSLVNHISLSR